MSEDFTDSAASAAPEGSDAVETTSDMHQFVNFYLRGECFGFPIDLVQEIIRVPDTIKVPLTPPSLLGVANLRGVVLPIVDLRSALGLDRIAAEDATRVMVVNCGQSIGLMVDRVAQVMNVPAEQIEPASSVDQTLDVDVLTGVVKEFNGEELVQIIDPKLVISRQFPKAAAGHGSVLTGTLSSADNDTATEEEEDGDMVQLVSLMLEGEEYAFPIEDVDEIVRVPAKISQVPGADQQVLGLINLRKRLLPLVCMRRVFGLPERERHDSNRVVVLRLGRVEGEDLRVGVVVDQVREVLGVPRAAQDRVPGVLRRGDRHEIGAICQLDEGRRLVSVLSSAVLFNQPALREACSLAAEQDQTADTSTDDETMLEQETMSENDESQLVIYQLDDQEFGVDIHAVQEIIRVPEVLARVPRAPASVEGIINLRGTVLPVVEMRRRFGLPTIDRNDRQRILVLNEEGRRTGYIVDSVAEVLRVPYAAMESAPSMSSAADRLVGRVANLQQSQRMVMVLDSSALVRDEMLPEDLLEADAEDAALIA